MPTKEDQIAAGEYCGVCGTTAENAEDYEQRKALWWYCSKEHAAEGSRLDK